MKRPRFRICGTRGSVPVTSSDVSEFGGNTSSYMLRTPSDTLVFLDAGTGIIHGCERVMEEPPKQAYLFFTHFHADHVEGLGVSRIAFVRMNGSRIKLVGSGDLEEGLSQYYSGYTFPVGPRTMSAIDFENQIILSDGMELDEATKVKTMLGNHPRKGYGGVLLYRFNFSDGSSIVYATDNEFDYTVTDDEEIVENPGKCKLCEDYIDFVGGANLLLADAQFTRKEYQNMTKGWGHSYYDQIIELARKADVELLVMSHHSQDSDDQRLRESEEYSKRFGEEIGLRRWQVSLAREGVEFEI